MASEQTGSGSSPLLGYASALHVPAAAGEGEAYWDGGSTLVVRNGTTLVPRCVLCGEPGSEPAIRLTLTWDSSFHMTRTTTLEMRQQANVQAYLCRRHHRRWSRARRWGGLGAVVALVVMFAGLALAVKSENSDVPAYTSLGIDLMIGAFAAGIVALFYFTLCSRTLSCRRIEEGYLYLEGAGTEFLRSLPRLKREEEAAGGVTPRSNPPESSLGKCL